MDTSDIKRFYNNKSALITGSTGFLGKVLLLKLLLSCPNIGVIYVLLRSKNDQTSEKRLAALLQSQPLSLFTDKGQNGNNLSGKKVVAINGDITAPGLGLSESDLQLLQDNVSVVFHCAASIKFDAPLKESLDHNLLGTKRVLEICKQMKNISCLVHVSTAYSHCQRTTVDEVLYPVTPDPNAMLQITEWLSAESVNQLTPYLLDGRPNTYTYTKALAEQYIRQEKVSFPVAIVRPSIVVHAYNEPLVGWIDNVNGPSGISILAALGILRCVNWNYYAVADFVPVDKVVNAIIAIGWRTGTSTNESLTESNEPKVYNVTTGSINPITWGQMFEYGYVAAKEAPSIRQVRPFIKPPKQRGPHPILNPLTVLVSHWLFAYFIDFLLLILGYKRIMVRITSKMHYALEVMNYFTQKQWTFKSDKIVSLWNNLSNCDKEEFNFDMSTIDWEEMGKVSHLGNRRYLLKEFDDNIPAAKKRLVRITIGYWIFKALLVILVAYAGKCIVNSFGLIKLF